MTASTRCCHAETLGHFGEGGPRPPVPGKEDVDIFTSDPVRPETYEPEGRACSDHARMRWAESLHTLLDDQEGITLFRSYLGRVGSADVIDFWLACRGFWLAYCTPPSCSYAPSSETFDKRRRKLAKAIYRKYIISGGIVGKIIKTATKMFIRDSICRGQLDSTLFVQAKEEVQERMEDAYQLFLKSDVFLTPSPFSNSIEQETINDKQEETGSSGRELKDNQETGNDNKELKSKRQEVPGFLPELMNRESESETDLTTANQERLIESDFQQATANQKRPEHLESSGGDVHYQSCKQRRNLQRIHHVTKNVHVEPQKFAAELISRLELVQRRNQRRQEKPEDADVSVANWDSTQTFSHHDNVDVWIHGDRGHRPGLNALAGSNNSEAGGYSWNRKCVCESMTVAYYFCGEPIPYQTSVKGGVVTLGHFKELLTKKGEFRFFFQKASEEFECGVVYEEVREDDTILPVFESRIIGKVERID
ncbi:axin-1-like [Trichomycterus rosablanca]|uniref:axin-1-like n=1 Tax=Trichomycterus rosablanca TaxID=2290929 RepID=UPI002F355FDA